jgi:hypothetical protein
VFSPLKRIFRRGQAEEREPADAEQREMDEQAPAPGSDTGAGLRHGQTPPGYVPPVDEGRPLH